MDGRVSRLQLYSEIFRCSYCLMSSGIQEFFPVSANNGCAANKAPGIIYRFFTFSCLETQQSKIVDFYRDVSRDWVEDTRFDIKPDTTHIHIVLQLIPSHVEHLS